MANKRNSKPTTTTTTTTTTTPALPAPAPAPMAPNGYTPTLLTAVQGACQLATGGGRNTVPPAGSTMGMVLGVLAHNGAAHPAGAPLGMVAAALGHATTTGGAHPLAPLVRTMVRRMGYSFACTPGGTMYLTGWPANGLYTGCPAGTYTPPTT